MKAPVALLFSVAVVASAPAQTRVSSADVQFLRRAAVDAMVEVSLGTAAQRKAVSPELRAIGARLAEHQGRAHGALTALAEARGVRLPATPGERMARRIQDVLALDGAEFDRRYARLLLRDQNDDLVELRFVAQETRDPEVKAFAQSSADAIASHLKEIERIQSALN